MDSQSAAIETKRTLGPDRLTCAQKRQRERTDTLLVENFQQLPVVRIKSTVRERERKRAVGWCPMLDVCSPLRANFREDAHAHAGCGRPRSAQARFSERQKVQKRRENDSRRTAICKDKLPALRLCLTLLSQSTPPPFLSLYHPANTRAPPSDFANCFNDYCAASPNLRISAP